MNSRISKTSHPHGLLLNFTDKIDIQRGEKTITLLNLNIHYIHNNSEFSYIKIWFTDQNNKPLEIEDRTNKTLIMKCYNYYKNALFS